MIIIIIVDYFILMAVPVKYEVHPRTYLEDTERE
jgi:hypothetical protein